MYINKIPLLSYYELQKIDITLRQWFTAADFIGIASINNYPIYPEEYALISTAASNRKKEFSTARWLARRGLKKFNEKNWPLLIGRLKNPIWPTKIIGSISHDGTLCVVVILHKKLLQAVGIDVIYLPKHQYNFDKLAPMFTTSYNEVIAMKTLSINVNPLILLFSIKESIVKAISQEINDFIDLRSIKLQNIHKKLTFKILNQHYYNTSIFGVVIGDYLLSLVKMFNN